jgi:aryl-alcohol dehydrogenase-like predicted oxidoreductase
VREELRKLREEGKVRLLGASIHDRPRAGRLARDSILDLLMIRYNAAHPGAEEDIFPHLAVRRPAVVAYTATSWRKLLRSPRGWTGSVPTAGDCYRFCLTGPHVDVVLTGPRSAAELRENLAAMDKGPLSDTEMEEMRAFGRAVRRNRG